MKKLMISALALLCLGLTACGETSESTAPETTTAAETTTTTAATTTETTTTTTEPMTTTTVETTTTTAQTTTETTTTEEPEEELYTVEECLTKIVEEQFGLEVDEVGYNSGNNCITIWLIPTDKFTYIDVLSEDLVEIYNSGEKVSINDFETDYSDYYGGTIFYEPKE